MSLVKSQNWLVSIGFSQGVLVILSLWRSLFVKHSPMRFQN